MDIDGEPVAQIGPFSINPKATRTDCGWLAARLVVARAEYHGENPERAEAFLGKVLAEEARRKAAQDGSGAESQ